MSWKPICRFITRINACDPFSRRKDPDLELDLDFTEAITNILVVALENKRFAREQLSQQLLNREIEIASQVQQMLFPAKLPNTDVLKAEVTYFPHSLVGGDYYDLIQKSEDQIYFCIADVSGKGISAALLMSNFQATLRLCFGVILIGDNRQSAQFHLV